MKKTQPKTIRLTAFAKPCFTHRISFQEKTPKGFVDKSFDTYKDHVEFKVGSNGVDASHLQQMKKSPDLIRQISFKSI